MYRDNFFVTPIWRDKLNLNLSLLNNLAREVKAQYPNSNQDDSQAGYRSPFITPGYFSEMDDLVKIVEKRAFQISHENSFANYSAELKITSMWININKGDNIIPVQDTPGSLFTGMFITKSTNKSGKINFYRNPSETFLIRSNNLNVDDKSIFSIMATYPSVENGLIIFPSWLSYGIEKCEDEEERISFSFNLNFIGVNNVPVL